MLAQDRLVAVCNGSSKFLASNGSVAPKLQIPSTAANGCSTCNCDRLGIPSSAPPIVVMHVAACRYPSVRNFRLDQRGQFPVRLIFDLASVRLRRAINQMWRVFKTNQPYSYVTFVFDRDLSRERHTSISRENGQPYSYAVVSCLACDYCPLVLLCCIVWVEHREHSLPRWLKI